MTLAPCSRMVFRYKNPHGKVVRLADVTALAQAIRNGHIGPQTPLAVGDESAFRPASLVVAYQQAAVGLVRNPLGTAPPDASSRAETPRPVGRLRWLLAGVAILGISLVLLLRSGGGSPPPDDAAGNAIASGPSPELRAALDALVSQFGDSIGVSQRHLEDWVARQRFEQRLSGSGLLSPGSLRTVRGLLARYGDQVDSVKTGADRQVVQLARQADSLEGSDAVKSGLQAATEAALADWRTDLSEYLALERAMIAATDSLAQFALSKQQSFVLREGEPFFLNHEDGARFVELRRSQRDLAERERRWAAGVSRKHPRWLTALEPDARPAFHPISAQRSNQ